MKQVPGRLVTALACLGLWLSAPVARGADIDNVVVYIECGPLANPTTWGSGVVVSADGHVLTARHVVDGQSDCRASKRVADRNNAAIANIVPVDTAVDLAMITLSQAGPHDFVPYCPLHAWMVRRKIFVAGFPGETRTGAASYRQGVLSTWRQNNQGVLETDGQTIEGMSGGPVFSSNLKGLVGIVIGASYTGGGGIDYFGILPVADYIQVFPGRAVTESAEPCYHETRAVDLSGLAGGRGPVWTTGEAPLPLGLGPEEGSCFLQRVFGQFNDPADTVEVRVEDGLFVLNGVNALGGTHGAEAACIWHQH